MVSSTPVNIQVGSNSVPITPASILTPAERLAAFQVLQTGHQSILIGSQGNAIGGSFMMGPKFAQFVASLVVPAGVTALRDFGTAGALTLTGNLTNAGTFYAASSNSGITTAVVSANNIINQQGALLSSVLPASVAATMTSAMPQLNLSLSAVQNILNAGSITSSGSLNLNAGGSIVNALPSGITGARPVIQAMTGINMMAGSGQITNAGLIAAATGNINIAANFANSLAINNLSGTIEALAGAINVRDSSYNGIASVSINGGNLLAKELNLHSGCGAVDILADTVRGRVNITAGKTVVSAATDDLQLGDITISGDPAFYNRNGDVKIEGDLQFNGQNLAIVASRDVITALGAGKIDTSNTNGNAGDIIVVAGASFTATPGLAPSAVQPHANPAQPDGNDPIITLTLTGASTTGGKIDLNTGTPITQFTANGVGPLGGGGGNVTLIAFNGSNPTSSNPGTITLPANVSIKAGASPGSSSPNGAIAIIAGAPVPAGSSVTPVQLGTGANGGSIDNTGSLSGGGGVTIEYAQPQVSSGNVIITGGTRTSGYFYGGPSTAGTVATGDLDIKTSGMTITSQASIEIGNLVTNGGALAVVSGKDVTSSTSGSMLDTSTAVADGGKLTIIAGLNLLPDLNAFPSPAGVMNTFHVPGTGDLSAGVTTGGSINLASTTKISTSANAATKIAGAIQFAALAGTAAGSGLISTPASTIISANSNSLGSTILIIGTDKGTGNSISVGPVENVANNNPVFNSLTITTGTPFLTGASLTNGLGIGIGCCDKNSGGGGTASIATGSLIDNRMITLMAQNVYVNGDITMQSQHSAASLSITTASSTEFQIGPGATGNGVNGMIIADAKAGSGAPAADIMITNKGTGGINLLSNAISTVSDTGAQPRLLQLLANFGPLKLNDASLLENGINAGGGSVTLIGAPIIVSGHISLAVSSCPACSTTQPDGQVHIVSKGPGDLEIGPGVGRNIHRYAW